MKSFLWIIFLVTLCGFSAFGEPLLTPPPPDSLLETRAEDEVICAGTKTKINILQSEIGVDYQVLTNGTPIAAAQTGNGGLLSFITSNLSQTTTFIIKATDATGSVTLPDVTVTVVNVQATYYGVNESLRGNDGSLEICVTSGIPPFSISQTNGGEATIRKMESPNCLGVFYITGLKAGNYGFSIVDAEGCSLNLSHTVSKTTECTGFQLNTINVKEEVKCKGDSTGVLEIVFDGGSLDKVQFLVVDVGNGIAPKKFTKAEIGAGTIFMEGLPAGRYTVVIIDDKGCQVEYFYNPLRISEPTDFVTMSGSVLHSSTVGGNNGSINICAVGGTPNYTLTLLPASGTITNLGSTDLCDGRFSITNLPKGDYNVLLTSEGGCTDSLTFRVNDAACSLAIASVEMDTVCRGNLGTMNVTISGGVAPFRISLDNGQTFSAPQNNTVFNIANLPTEDEYQLVVSDGANCTDRNNVHLVFPQHEATELDVYVSHVTTNNGNNGEIRICANGGGEPYTFAMSPNTGTMQQTNNSCDSLFFIRNLQAGTYQVSVTNANGCVTTQKITVLEPTCTGFTIDLDSLETTRIQCFNDETGTIKVKVDGGTPPYSYSLTGTSPIISQDPRYVFHGLDTGSYYVFVTDANGCFAPSRDTLKVVEAVELTSTFDVVPPCPGLMNGIICLTPQGGNEAQLPPHYFYSLFDSDDKPITVVLGDTLCDGEYYAAGLGKGVYFGILKDSLQCESHGMIDLPEQPIEVSASSVSPTCEGQSLGSVSASATGYGEIKYVWNNGSTQTELTNLAAGQYSVTATDARGCSVADTVNVQSYRLELAFAPTATCPEKAKGTVNLSVQNATSPVVFSWSNGANTEDLINVLPATYTVTVTDSKGCKNVGTTTVSSYNVSTTATPTPTCKGRNNGLIETSTNNGITPYSYIWSNNANNANIGNLAPGNYTVTVTDINGCTAVTNATINEYEITLSFDAKGTCQGVNGGNINLSLTNAREPITYRWSNGDVTQDISNVPAGDYTVTITDALNCTANSRTNIQSFSNPTVEATGETTLTVGENGQAQLGANVTGGTSPYTYLWSPPAGLNQNNIQNPVASPIQTTTYVVRVTDTNGCTAQDNVLVEVILIRVPTGFTPNGDSHNDTFEPYIPNDDVIVTLMQVFDRWGKKVYETSNATPWDGKFNGKDQPLGTYVYALQYRTELGRTGTLKGYFTLIR